MIAFPPFDPAGVPGTPAPGDSGNPASARCAWPHDDLSTPVFPRAAPAGMAREARTATASASDCWYRDPEALALLAAQAHGLSAWVNYIDAGDR